MGEHIGEGIGPKYECGQIIHIKKEKAKYMDLCAGKWGGKILWKFFYDLFSQSNRMRRRDGKEVVEV